MGSIIRIEKTINGVTTKYLYDGLDIIQEKDQNGAVTVNYIRTLNIDEPLTRIKGTTIRHYVTDALGSMIGLADDTGVMKTTYTYDPFGNTTVSGEASDNPFQYTGRENDGTGLYYYRARYYSPDLQRFLSEDPIGLKGGDVNFYAYVGNNPVNKKDPTGLSHLVCGRDSKGHPKCEWVEDPEVPRWVCKAATHIICEVGCHSIVHNPFICFPLCMNIAEFMCPKKCE